MHVTEAMVNAETPLLSNSNSLWSSDKQNYTNESGAMDATVEIFPLPSWTLARKDKNGRVFPQAIAHRGYKAVHPENTFKAFQGAVEVGAHAIETDVHLTKDNVVVLSHDGDLKRCFGHKEKIIDCEWDFINELRTIKAPHEPMPRLQDLLQYIALPGLEDKWVLLDIKLDNNADDVIRLIAETIKSVPENPSRAWTNRIVLGIWAVKFVPLCQKYLPGFPISHIGFSTCYARQFLKVPNCSFNMLQKVLFGPIGASFMKEVTKAGRQLFVWTVNDDNLMRWSIQRRVDGVITDDPKRFKEICDNYGDHESVARVSIYQWLYTIWLYIMIGTFWFAFNRRFPEKVETWMKTKNAKKQATLKIGA